MKTYEWIIAGILLIYTFAEIIKAICVVGAQ